MCIVRTYIILICILIDGNRIEYTTTGNIEGGKSFIEIFFFFYKLLVVNYIAVIIQFAKNLQDCKLPYEGDIYLLRWLIGMSFNIFHDILC